MADTSSTVNLRILGKIKSQLTRYVLDCFIQTFVT